MNSLIMCTAVVLSIVSRPGGPVVGTVPAYKAVQIEDVSLLRDYVFVSNPGPDGSRACTHKRLMSTFRGKAGVG